MLHYVLIILNLSSQSVFIQEPLANSLSFGHRSHKIDGLLNYSVGVVCLAASEVGYGAWMVASLASWWRTAPQAELARKGMDLIHDLKPALLAIERYRDIARPAYDMIEEVEREAPNNVFVIIIFGVLGIILQIAAFVMARRLARGPRVLAGSSATREELAPSDKERAAVADCACAPDDSDSQDSQDVKPGWRKKANLRMYTILDKIF
ncbi:hypothetical protein NE865_09663 [Phthorimaea operculella]|nr:hypothetical protein NE865_09663 [Phthorimaea operculella]